MGKTEIRVETSSAFFERGRKMAALADGGKRIPESRVVAFESVEQLIAVLSAKRVLLLRAVKETPGSIAELARRLRRDRSAVTRDVQVLERYGGGRCRGTGDRSGSGGGVVGASAGVGFSGMVRVLRHV